MVCRSLIKFEPVNFEGPKDFDVIFFSSIRCAQFLETSECIDLHSYSLCCAGPQTASRLKRMGYEPAFVGKNASMPDVVSKDFTKWLGKRRVFIPCSNRSLIKRKWEWFAFAFRCYYSNACCNPRPAGKRIPSTGKAKQVRFRLNYFKEIQTWRSNFSPLLLAWILLP